MRRMPDPLGLTPAVRRRTRTIAWIVCLTLAGAVFAPGAWAQDIEVLRPFDLSGQVVDEGGRALVGAFVALLGDDWGVLTDEDGEFDVDDIYPGKLSLTVDLLGYETLSWEGEVSSADTVSLTLVSKPLLMENLATLTDRLHRRSNATSRSVRVFEWEALSTTTSRSVLDFLYSRGGLLNAQCARSFTNECISVNGNVIAPVVWVDEARVVGGLSYFRVAQPHEFYMLEVYASGRHIRAYSTFFMARAAAGQLQLGPLIF